MGEHEVVEPEHHLAPFGDGTPGPVLLGEAGPTSGLGHVVGGADGNLAHESPVEGSAGALHLRSPTVVTIEARRSSRSLGTLWASDRPVEPAREP